MIKTRIGTMELYEQVSVTDQLTDFITMEKNPD